MSNDSFWRKFSAKNDNNYKICGNFNKLTINFKSLEQAEETLKFHPLSLFVILPFDRINKKPDLRTTLLNEKGERLLEHLEIFYDDLNNQVSINGTSYEIKEDIIIYPIKFLYLVYNYPTNGSIQFIDQIQLDFFDQSRIDFYFKAYEKYFIGSKYQLIKTFYIEFNEYIKNNTKLSEKYFDFLKIYLNIESASIYSNEYLFLKLRFKHLESKQIKLIDEVHIGFGLITYLFDMNDDDFYNFIRNQEYIRYLI